MDRRLRVMAGPDRGASYTLPESGLLTIGRVQKHNDICIHDETLSRVHCQVEVDDARVELTDLESETGTFVNGKRVTKQRLQHADVIRIGKSEITFQAIAGTAPRVQSHDDVPVPAAPAPPEPVEAVPATPLTEALGDLPIGTPIGHYTLGPVLGKGHCGVVYRAHDARHDRAVAVKVLQPEFPRSEEEMQRFAQVMKAALHLRHPNLVTVFGAGRTGPVCWVALEYVEGESAVQLLQRATDGALEWQTAFRVAVHVGRALHVAEHNGLVHCNITPHNILVRGADNCAKLADLSQTKALTGSVLRQLTMRARVQSDLAYMAPEQTQPKSNLDVRTDIYCLGVVVYALLTGRLPFAGKTAAETIQKIRGSEPAPPSEGARPVPGAFDDMILKMLAKRPEQRYQSAKELLVDLARLAPDPWW